MKPVCVPCQRFMRCKKTGFYFLEGKPYGHPTEKWDGLQGKNSLGWTPYKLWIGDLFECPDCGASTISGVAHQRVAEHYEEDFHAWVTGTGAVQFMVKDC